MKHLPLSVVEEEVVVAVALVVALSMYSSAQIAGVHVLEVVLVVVVEVEGQLSVVELVVAEVEVPQEAVLDMPINYQRYGRGTMRYEMNAIPSC